MSGRPCHGVPVIFNHVKQDIMIVADKQAGNDWDDFVESSILSFISSK
jgi:hypothetical protein